MNYLFNINWNLIDDGDTFMRSDAIDLKDEEYFVLFIDYPRGAGSAVRVGVEFYEWANDMPALVREAVFISGGTYANQIRAVKMFMDALDEGGHFDDDFSTDADGVLVEWSLTKSQTVGQPMKCNACDDGDDDISSPAHVTSQN